MTKQKYDDTARCQRCGRFKSRDALLLCRSCVGTNDNRQDARVTPQTAGLPETPASGTMTATTRDASGRKVLRAKLDRNIRARDRQADETREMVFDFPNDKYRQTWREPSSGAKTFHKQGKNSDPNLHGPASHKPTKPSAMPDKPA